MENTVTINEIEEFLDRSLNYATMKKKEREWGKAYHKIEEYVYETGIAEGDVAKNYRTISLIYKNAPTYISDIYVGDIKFYPDGTIYYIDIDSFYLKREVDFGKDNNLYIGTNMREELRKRFLGKKLEL